MRLKENASLDYEMIPMFTFQVHAEDGFTTSPTLFVVVHVTDINEPPISNRDKLLIRSPEGEVIFFYYIHFTLHLDLHFIKVIFQITINKTGKKHSFLLKKIKGFHHMMMMTII